MRAFYTASSLFALVDLPMALVFVAIVMALATPAVGLVLLGFAVVALLVGLSSQRRVARQAREGAAYANLKTGLLVEAVEGAEKMCIRDRRCAACIRCWCAARCSTPSPA